MSFFLPGFYKLRKKNMPLSTRADVVPRGRDPPGVAAFWRAKALLYYIQRMFEKILFFIYF